MILIFHFTYKPTLMELNTASNTDRSLEIYFESLLIINQYIWAQCLQSHLSKEHTQVLVPVVLFYTRSFYSVDNDRQLVAYPGKKNALAYAESDESQYF